MIHSLVLRDFVFLPAYAASSRERVLREAISNQHAQRNSSTDNRKDNGSNAKRNRSPTYERLSPSTAECSQDNAKEPTKRSKD